MIHTTRFDGFRALRLTLRFLLTAGVAVLAVLGTTRIAQAQAGLEVLKEDWNAAKEQVESSRVFDDPDLFGEAVVRGWRSALPDLNAAAESQIVANNPKLPKGVSLYEVKSQLGDTPTVVTRQEGDTVHVTVAIPRNLFIAKSTTPTVFGSYADPKFSVDYDAVIDVSIAIPTRTQPLRVTDMTAVISNVKLDSQNAPADVIKAVGSVIDFFGGPNFRAILEKMIAARSTTGINGFIDQNLGPVNTILADLSRQGFTVLNVLNDLQARQSPRPAVQVASARGRMAFRGSGGKIMLLVYRENYAVATVGPGVVTGTIRWAKELGRPNGTESPFVFTARVAAGPVTPNEGPRFDLPRKDFAPPVESHIEETASGYVCHYVLHSLPYNVPMTLSVAKRADVDWVALNPQPLPPKSAAFIPAGWEGRVLVRPAPKFVSASVKDQATLSVSHASVANVASPPASAASAASISSASPVVRPVSSFKAAKALQTTDSASIAASAIHPQLSAAKATSKIVSLPPRSNPEGAGQIDRIDFTLSMTPDPVIR